MSRTTSEPCSVSETVFGIVSETDSVSETVPETVSETDSVSETVSENSVRNRFGKQLNKKRAPIDRISCRLRWAILDFRGLGGLGRPGQPSKRWGGETPLTPHVFPAARGRPDTQHPKLLFLVWPPLFVPSPCAGICGSLAPGGGQLKTVNFGFSGSGRPWATGATVKKVGGGRNPSHKLRYEGAAPQTDDFTIQMVSL